MTQGDVSTDRILSAGQNAVFTDSIHILQPIKQRHRKQPPSDVPKSRTVRVVTSSNPSAFEPEDDAPISHFQINVQPLLILDLNGVLCHRIRRRQHQAPPVMSHYRSQLGPKIAQTPIIPRPDLLHFLEYLDRHFCLAIWTSAKAKTSKKLVDLLVPKSIKDRLLFVWSQNHCQVDESPNTTDTKETIFIKDLDLVWQKYPLWNRHNTLLMDDSPEKCARWKENALHPPPLHGLNQKTHDTQKDSAATVWLSDEDNVHHQFVFMEKLAEHWNACPVTQTWDSRVYDETPPSVINENMAAFLNNHAREFMGWQG